MGEAIALPWNYTLNFIDYLGLLRLFFSFLSYVYVSCTVVGSPCNLHCLQGKELPEARRKLHNLAGAQSNL